MEDADVTLRSGHLPLKKFLEKNTLNTKVNNWAIEISPFRIQFEYIKGIKNTLADTMSRLINITPDTASECEPEGYEFGYYAFEDIGPIKTMQENEEINEVNIDPIDKAIPEHQDSQWKLRDEQISRAQSRDTFCQNINQKLEKGTLIPRQPYFTEN